MSKVGFWLKGSKGKLAGATIYQSNGETVMREIVSPSNPKTTAQIIQRIIMHTVMSAYSLLKEICDHSFEGMKAGRDTMAYFMKQNLNICRESVADMQAQGVDMYDMYNFLPLGMRKFVANQYQIAMGSLPQIRVVFDAEGMKVAEITTNTYQGVMDAFGLQRGDQLTFMHIGEAGGSVQKEFHFARVILDPTDAATGLPLDLSTPFIVGGAVNAPSVRNEGQMSFANDLSNGLYFTYGNNFNNIAGAVIVSRKKGEDWLRSTTYMAYADNSDYSLGECIDRAENGANGVYVANSRYLNNAGTNQAENDTVSVESALIDNQAMVVGTPKVIALANGTSFPVAKTVAITMSGATTATVQIKNNATGDVVATAELNNEASKSVSVSAAKNVQYDVYVGGTSTGFSFKFTEQSGGLPDSGGEG